VRGIGAEGMEAEGSGAVRSGAEGCWGDQPRGGAGGLTAAR